MSEFFLIIIWFAVVAILFKVTPATKYEYACGVRVLHPKWFYAVLLLAPLLYMVATRSNAIGDTYAYEVLYKAIPTTWAELVSYIPTVTKDKGFTLLSGVIKLIFGGSTRSYFFVLALIQGLALIYVYRKYSYSYFISMFLFIPTAYFAPMDYQTGKLNRTDVTHSVHWYNASWQDEAVRREQEKLRKLSSILGVRLAENLYGIINCMKREGLFRYVVNRVGRFLSRKVK